jgi:hypothetical protein
MFKLWKFFKYALLASSLLIITIAIYLLISIYHHKKTDPYILYLEDKFHNPQRAFILESFDKIKTLSKTKYSLILAADISEGDIILPLEKGYNVIAFDWQRIYYDLMVPYGYPYKDKVTTHTDWNFKTLPKIDLLMASFIFPFYNKSEFYKTWLELDAKIVKDGYFIGNFFGPENTIFAKTSDLSNTNFLTESEIKMLFKNYNIIFFKEIKKHSTIQDGVDHYYDVFAQKLR